MREAQVHSPSIGFVYPFKGTALREQVIREKLFNPAIEEYGTAQWKRNHPVIKNDNITIEEYEGIFRTFILYCKFPKRYWSDLRIAEKKTDVGNRMFEKLKEIYYEEYFDRLCSNTERCRYVPGIAIDAAFPHST